MCLGGEDDDARGANERPSEEERSYGASPGRLLQRTSDDEPLQNPRIRGLEFRWPHVTRVSLSVSVWVGGRGALGRRKEEEKEEEEEKDLRRSWWQVQL